MRSRSCIPVWSYEEGFYTALLEGTKMIIRTDPVKGKGLFAKQAIVSGEIVHQETALVCSQNMDDMASGVPVCLHCLRSLETPRRVVGRVCRSKKTALGLPFGKLVAPETPVPCVYERFGCAAQFCSARCRESAWNGYHAVMCEGRMSSEGQKTACGAFTRLEWVQNGVDYSDTAIVALRAVGQFLTRHRVHGLSLEESYLPFSQLIKAPIDKFFFTYLLKASADEENGEQRAQSDQEAYAELQNIKKDPFTCEAVRWSYTSGGRTKEAFINETLDIVYHMLAFTEEEKAFFSPAKWSELLGAVLLNGQERSPPSYYSLLKDMATAALTEAGGEEKFKVFEAAVGRTHPHVDLDDLLVSTRGQGIYTVGCLFNHSCEPNLQVIYSNNNDETLSVMALRDIVPDEELCISYIEESMSFPKRQEQLYQHYLFECGCSKCASESRAFVQ